MEIKKWNEISADELESRMFRHKVLHDEPISMAGAMVYRALDDVLRQIGINVDADDVDYQQQLMGVHVIEMGKDGGWSEDCYGYVVYWERFEDVPYAYIHDPKIESNGDVVCEVWYYVGNYMEKYRCGVNMGKVVEGLDSGIK